MIEARNMHYQYKELPFKGLEKEWGGGRFN